jgi:uncharacterized DUF497 family protein
MARYRDFEWDDAKDRQNLAKHGLPLIAAAALFDLMQSTAHPRRTMVLSAAAGRLARFEAVW